MHFAMDDRDRDVNGSDVKRRGLGAEGVKLIHTWGDRLAGDWACPESRTGPGRTCSVKQKGGDGSPSLGHRSQSRGREVRAREDDHQECQK